MALETDMNEKSIDTALNAETKAQNLIANSSSAETALGVGKPAPEPAGSEHEKKYEQEQSTCLIEDVPVIVIQCDKDEYLVKTIDWKNKKVCIITQNENGPCPLVAICNVLFLRGDLEIRPPDREFVTFEYLVDRLGDYLLTHAPTDEPMAATDTTTKTEKLPQAPKRQDTSEFVLTYRHNLDTALSILPNLKSGLDVNVKFDNIHGFEPTAELAMFDLFNVNLVHGWVADPQDVQTYDVIVNKCGTYNHVVELIVQADELSTSQSNKGGLVTESLTTAQEEKLHEGFVANEFLKDTATQLTYFGLDLLLESIPTDTLCVLFRNNHFSTVYRHPTLGLYMLVTDSGLVSERSVIWESLADVDQGSSEFRSSSFSKPNIQESKNSSNHVVADVNADLDYAIAVSLQDEQKRQYRQSLIEQQQQQQQQQHITQNPPSSSSDKPKKNNNCTVS
ncbi:hypothetical protein BD408DRAFT_412898 [Parasitella parasitica]|nr:hypothetical protein BD408DRAFT_412898 [Parasitella parasitica]